MLGFAMVRSQTGVQVYSTSALVSRIDLILDKI